MKFLCTLIIFVFTAMTCAVGFSAEASDTAGSILDLPLPKASASAVKLQKKSFFFESELIRSAIGIANIKAHFAISEAFALGLGYYNYNVRFNVNSRGVKSRNRVKGASYNLISTYAFSGDLSADGYYGRIELGYTELKLEGAENFEYIDLAGFELSEVAKGYWAFTNVGHHWQWKRIFLNLYAGLQIAHLESSGQQAEGTSTVYGIDLGALIGVAF